MSNDNIDNIEYRLDNLYSPDIKLQNGMLSAIMTQGSTDKQFDTIIVDYNKIPELCGYLLLLWQAAKDKGEIE